MSTNSVLRRAILAMDAYNRGYDAGMKLTGLEDLGTVGVGEAAIIDTVLPSGAQAASFYAVAYTVGTETIISYRGTDNLLADPFTGWPVTFGNTTTSQADLAVKFFLQVVGGHDNALFNNVSK